MHRDVSPPGSSSGHQTEPDLVLMSSAVIKVPVVSSHLVINNHVRLRRTGLCERVRDVRLFAGEQDVCLEKQVERFEWQLRTLKEVLSANGNTERAELLKEHADEDACALVLSILDKVKTETTADLNVLYEQKSKTVAEEHERLLEGTEQKRRRPFHHCGRGNINVGAFLCRCEEKTRAREKSTDGNV